MRAALTIPGRRTRYSRSDDMSTETDDSDIAAARVHRRQESGPAAIANADRVVGERGDEVAPDIVRSVARASATSGVGTFARAAAERS